MTKTKWLAKTLDDYLDEVYCLLRVYAQYYLFKHEVVRMVGNPKCKTKRVEKVVRGVVKRMQLHPKVEVNDESTHDGRAVQVEALQWGMKKLDEIRSDQAPDIQPRDLAAEDSAIIKDNETFKYESHMAWMNRHPEIKVYHTEHPSRPHCTVIPADILVLPRCDYVAEYFVCMFQRQSPHLWERRYNPWQRGLSWTYLDPKQDVTEKELELIERPATREYIVALTRQNNYEVPWPIDLPQSPCCQWDNPCQLGDLNAHLATWLGFQTPVQAFTIREGISVPKRGLDIAHLVEPQTNRLFVKW